MNGRYIVYEKLGSGSYGSVSSGVNAETKFKVAIKEFNDLNKDEIIINEKLSYELNKMGISHK